MNSKNTYKAYQPPERESKVTYKKINEAGMDFSSAILETMMM